ncbi:MAG: hypothetical protein LBG88_00315 [Christensenellaceae bacterium]|jgi:hypothetical protein|nr:hypothetical protein [Christensenellaceae bacterium]
MKNIDEIVREALDWTVLKDSQLKELAGPLDNSYIFKSKGPQTDIEYFKKVQEAILANKLSPDEAIKATQTTTGEFCLDLKKKLAFGNYITDGISHVADTEEGKFYTPTVVIVKLSKVDAFMGNQLCHLKEFNKKVFDTIDDPGNERRFLLHDAADMGSYIKDEDIKAYNQDCEYQPFHLLNWKKNGNYETPVEQYGYYPRVSMQRFKTYKQIHHTIEDIAAKTMQDNGITF